MLEGRGTDFTPRRVTTTRKTTDAIIDLLKNKQVPVPGRDLRATDTIMSAINMDRSEEVKDAVLAIDRAVGRLVEGLKEQGHL
jgi:hypothetical protein